MFSRNIWNLSFGAFLSRTRCQKYSAWFPRVPVTFFMLKCFQVAEIHLNLIVSKKWYFSGETMLYFHQFTDFERHFDFFILKIICRRKFYKIFYYSTKILYVIFYLYFHFSKIYFAVQR